MTNRIVDLWWTDLDTIDLDDTVLTPDETGRASHFKAERDRRRYVAGRWWLRSVLARYVDEPPVRLRFASGEFGKPALTFPDPTLEFSLAHSASLALLAVGRYRPVGVDVEQLRDAALDEPAARLVLSSTEIEFIQRSRDRDQAFLRCWTRKEAYAKVGGRGLERELAQLTLTNLSGQPLNADGYKVIDLAGQGAVAALAIPGDYEVQAR